MYQIKQNGSVIGYSDDVIFLSACMKTGAMSRVSGRRQAAFV